MGVAACFGPVLRNLSNLAGPYDMLVLEGGQLKTKEGVIVAEMRQDSEGRWLWMPYSSGDGQICDGTIEILGMGRP